MIPLSMHQHDRIKSQVREHNEMQKTSYVLRLCRYQIHFYSGYPAFDRENPNFTYFYCEIYFHQYNISIILINKFHTSSGKKTAFSYSKLKSYTQGTGLFSIVFNLYMCAYIFHLFYILILFMECILHYLCSHSILGTICFPTSLASLCHRYSSMTFLIYNVFACYLFAVIFSYSCFLPPYAFDE